MDSALDVVTTLTTLRDLTLDGHGYSFIEIPYLTEKQLLRLTALQQLTWLSAPYKTQSVYMNDLRLELCNKVSPTAGSDHDKDISAPQRLMASAVEAAAAPPPWQAPATDCRYFAVVPGTVCLSGLWQPRFTNTVQVPHICSLGQLTHRTCRLVALTEMLLCCTCFLQCRPQTGHRLMSGGR